MNLINDPWIPAVRSGQVTAIRPDQIAESSVSRLAWPRPDLEIACCEMLVGLLYMADPPRDSEDWECRRPNPARLRQALEPFAPSFELAGSGRRFLQDVGLAGNEALKPLPITQLFLDGPGASGTKKNADLMVHREIYGDRIESSLAAMALYTLQAYAPTGGSGHRVSMRGGGPLVTLVRPRLGQDMRQRASFWSFIWANVPIGEPLDPTMTGDKLPWMFNKIRTSGKNETHAPPEDDIPLEAFFGMPRRILLNFDEAEKEVVSWLQCKHGANYIQWKHPLTPYYRRKDESDGGGFLAESFPQLARPDKMTYRSWVGILLGPEDEGYYKSRSVSDFQSTRYGEKADAVVAGWAMKKATPVEFVLSEQPIFTLSKEKEAQAAKLIRGADIVFRMLVKAIKDIRGLIRKPDGAEEGNLRELFYMQTQNDFENLLSSLGSQGDYQKIAARWLIILRSRTMRLYSQRVLRAMAGQEVRKTYRALMWRKKLLKLFARELPDALELETTQQKDAK